MIHTHTMCPSCGERVATRTLARHTATRVCQETTRARSYAAKGFARLDPYGLTLAAAASTACRDAGIEVAYVRPTIKSSQPAQVWAPAWAVAAAVAFRRTHGGVKGLTETLGSINADPELRARLAAVWSLSREGAADLAERHLAPVAA